VIRRITDQSTAHPLRSATPLTGAVKAYEIGSRPKWISASDILPRFSVMLRPRRATLTRRDAPPPFGRGHRVLRSERQPARSTGAPTPWSPSPAIAFLGGVLAAARLRMACLSVTSWAWTWIIWSGWWCATAELSEKFLCPGAP